MSAPAYNTALAVYFIAYVIFEVPANVRSIIIQLQRACN